MRIIKLLKNLYRYLFMIIIFSAFQVTCELYLPNIMSKIIDTGIIKSNISFIRNNIFIMIGIAFIAIIAQVLVIYSSNKFASSLGYKIRSALYKKINELSKKEIDNFGTATLITRCTNDVTNVTEIMSHGLRLILFVPIMLIGASFMAYKSANELTIIIVLSVSVLIVFILIIFIMILPKMNLIQKMIDKINQVTREVLYGLRVIKAFNKTSYFKNRFNKVNFDNMNLNIFINKVLILVQPIMMLTINIATIIVIYFSIDLIKAGSINIGTMMAFIQYEVMILTSFLMMLIMVVAIPRMFVSFKRINDILKLSSSIKDEGKLILKEVKSIEFKHIFYKYDNADDYILKDISFKINSKENIGIIGSSGSGKSTIINLLLRHIDTTKGEILINDKNIREYRISSLRKCFSYVPQKPLLFKGSIKENLVFDENHSIKDLDKFTDYSSINDFVSSLDNKYDYQIEQSGVNLSGGQKQRFTISRALLNNGSVLLFDDSFSSIDYSTDKKIRESLNKNFKNKIILMITQRVGTIKNSNKIIVIDDGMIESIGTYEELSSSSKVFKEFILSQSEVNK